MLSPEEFREKYPEEKLAEELPDSPIGSLRDIQYLYGKLYTLATTGGGEYAPYLTPDAADDLLDTDQSLIVVRVDLSGEEPRLADDLDPVSVTRYSDELVQKVGHCKYPAARGIDHSITHQAGKNSDPEKLARYAQERLTKWATDDVVQEATEDHEHDWVIDALAELGEDEGALGEIEDTLTTKLGGESATALLTVKVRLDEGGKYLWPGDLDVFSKAMRQRKLSKLVTKNKAKNSSGEATDLVTGQPARTVGTSEDPQNYFLGKQLEKYPGLDIEEAWRTHPISEDAAVTVMNAETFVEACTYRTFGAKVYCLPYFFGRPSPKTTRKLYDMLYLAENSDESNVTPIEKAYRDRVELAIDENSLRFYISAVMPHQMSRYDVFGETLNGRIQYPAELARSHVDVLRTAAFLDDDDWSAALPTSERWDLLNDEGPLGAVASGWYFAQTLPTGDDDASADDIRIEALVDVLSGTPIPVSMLLDGYVERLIEEGSDERFPAFRVASQYAQLCALACAHGDFLAPNEQQRLIAEPPTYEPRTMTSRENLTITDGGFAGEQNLEAFIENTPALENDQRCGAFLLGALVGAVGNYQEWHEGRSTTLVDQFPVKSVSTNRIKKVAQDAIEKTLTYTREEKKRGGQRYPGTKFDYIVDRLRETILNPDPDDWDLDKNDLRFYYALGVTYGMNDRPITEGDVEDEPTEIEEVAQ
ncbi:type I-B CRISPR-associated protein Cas8b/Csh1 [Halococcus sp. IIIV-5B]|uniref:type I-B CRISPR-associated protein Cas8b/Csh1 n=1 Tax=Halococcus sp. IIIV-5B TaxID=2321230 RepID=UPI000E75427C|nr:type I-B CRISPR-associated protein Cas8b/Csh1 [Halococcus sp. IIIV-5B]RJT07552.1 type I-B CRISPR-associated protein Cas8b/Csh1 [Halococcus sp. IIIV-5B]